MSFGDTVSGITAFAAIVAAVAAIFAARYTKRAAEEAAKAANASADQATASAEQVRLQRPRPIVVITFSYSFNEYKGNVATDNNEFWIQNIGDSPAFDVEVSPLETPGIVASLGEVSRLETMGIAYLVQGVAPIPCEHTLKPSRGALGIRRAAGFVHDAKEFFNQQSIKDEASRTKDYTYEIKFSVSYRSLEGRRFTQDYRLVIYFVLSNAWVELVGSLLEAKVSPIS
jgi:hypothetical protein